MREDRILLMSARRHDMRTLLAVLLLGFAGLALGQSSGGEEGRGSTPPGTARDGSRPSDGAIKGGSILPGESAGVPDSKLPSGQARERCKELTGSLREECLRHERDAAIGGTKPPMDTRPDVGRDREKSSR
jgi:hypothetical protein